MFRKKTERVMTCKKKEERRGKKYKNRSFTALTNLALALILFSVGAACLYDGGGAVTAAVTGKKELVGLTIKPDVVDAEDVEMLQDLVISAVNEALRQADEAMNSSMSSLTGGLNIPGLGL